MDSKVFPDPRCRLKSSGKSLCSLNDRARVVAQGPGRRNLNALQTSLLVKYRLEGGAKCEKGDSEEKQPGKKKG